MRQLLISTMICVFVFAACDISVSGTVPVDNINGSNDDDPSINPTIDPEPEPDEIPTGDPWSIPITNELSMETIDNESVYLIETWRDIEYISANFETNSDLLTYTYHVTKNIRFPDLTDENIPTNAQDRSGTKYESFYVDNDGLIPIGVVANPFTGTFDGLYEGNTYIIDDLVIDKQNQTDVGLFGAVGSNTTGATLKNIVLKNATVHGNDYVGGLVGSIHGTNTVIDNSSVQGDITGRLHVGGLAGFIKQGTRITITNSHTSGSVKITGAVGGGLIGSIDSSQMIAIRDTSSNSTITGTQNVIGGLIGFIAGTEVLTITTSFASGDVSGSDDVGGLIGTMNGIGDGNVSDNYATGQVTSGSRNTGGLISSLDNISSSLSITRNYAGSAVKLLNNQYAYAGGIIGVSDQESSIDSLIHNYWDQDAQSSPGVSYGIGKTTEGFLGQSSNAGAAPLQSPQQSEFETWDFDGEDAVWVWNDGAWPTLVWQEEN